MTGALAGIRVLDLSRVLAGPWATMTLGDLGAEIIKVEQPGRGDDTRHWGPFAADGKSVYFLSCNRNKRSVAIDFSCPEGASLVRDLVAGTDVLVENYRTGALSRYGLDYETLSAVNPRLVYCSISGFGRDSPMAGRAGYDVVAQAESGVMSVTGAPDGEPVKIGLPMADLVAGGNAVQGILAALLQRERTGRGQMVDIALLDGMVSMLAIVGAECLLTGERPRRYGNSHPVIVPYQAFGASDGRFLLAIANDMQFRLLCEKVLDRPELAADPRFVLNADRARHRDFLIPLLAGLFIARPVAHWLDLLERAGIPAGRIRHVDEVLEAPEVLARGLVQSLHDGAIEHRVVGSPLRLSAAPISNPRPPPSLGADTDGVLTELGLDAAAIAALRNAGTIGGPQAKEV